MALTYKEVAEILKLIDASQCEEVVLELEGLRLVVRRSSGAPRIGQSLSNTTTDAPTSPLPIAKTGFGAARSIGHTQAELTAAEGRIAVRAPMVGTFYRRPSPQEKPFAEVGQRIKAGSPLCLIEVMKLFTTIPSPADGVIESIAVEDGSAVEFDQLLFVVRPSEAN